MHLEKALWWIGIKNSSLSFRLGPVWYPQWKLIVIKSLNILPLPKLLISLGSYLLRLIILKPKLRLYFNIVNPGNKNGSLRMGAHFMSTSKGFWDLQQSKKRIFLSPLAGSILILKNNSDKDKSIFSEGQFVIHAEAYKCLLVLQYSEEIYLQNHLSLHIFKQTGKDIFLLWGW